MENIKNEKKALLKLDFGYFVIAIFALFFVGMFIYLIIDVTSYKTEGIDEYVQVLLVFVFIALIIFSLLTSIFFIKLGLQNIKEWKIEKQERIKKLN